jgi:intracellular septation protein
MISIANVLSVKGQLYWASKYSLSKRSLMHNKLVSEFLPMIIFFILYECFDLFVATAGLIGVTALQLIYSQYRYGRVEKQQWVTFILLVIFGSFTIAFQDPRFLQWKVSVINWGFALVCLLSPVFTRKTLFEHLMGKQLVLPQAVWKKLNRMWMIFFVTMGTLNIWVAYQYSTETWVYFKLFGILGLTFLFMVGQSIYLMKHMKGHS